jgi:ATP-dependent protease ClpP protease subunit
MNQVKFESLNQRRSRYGDDGPREFMVGFVPHKSGTYRIEIDDVIENVAQFSTAIQVLEQAKEDDEVIITLQTDGGNVNATDAFIHALRKCEAPIHIQASGGTHSAGTHILLEGDSIELSNGFNALLHCGSDGAIGGVNEYRIKSQFDEKFRTQQFKETYEGFLSDKELDAMLDGRDIWLDAHEWMERAEKRSHYFRAKYEASLKAPRKPRAKASKPAEKAVDKAPKE